MLGTLADVGIIQNLQPSQSFKSRGISHFAQHALKTHGSGVHLVIASGGNAGLAAACAARALQVRCTVFLPEGVSASTVDFMKREGAEVITEGKCYLQALGAAERAVATDVNACVLSAYLAIDIFGWIRHTTAHLTTGILQCNGASL